jgi:3-oxoadipate enol-lactonase
MTSALQQEPRSIDVPTSFGSIHCRVEGSVGAPWLLFSNSHVTNLTMWDPQVEALKGQYRIARYDQRGHGGTSAPAGPYDFDDLSSDLLVVMNALEIERASLIGVSMGAVTVLRAAARWPGRVRSVVASDGQWRSPAQARTLWQQRIDLVEANSTAALAEQTASRWFRPQFAAREPTTFARIVQMISATSTNGYVGCAQAMQSYDFSADYPLLPMPVLYVVGREDGGLPAAMRAMAESTPASRFVEIDAAGHLPSVEQPEQFFAAVAPFLESSSLHC